MNTPHTGLQLAGRIAGWVIAVLIAALMVLSATGKLLPLAPDAEQPGPEFPPGVVFAIGIVELACVILYLFPYTAVLGAVLLTGYLGGAVAVHAQMGDYKFFIPFLVGVFVWLGLFFRDARVRALLPVRWRLTAVDSK